MTKLELVARILAASRTGRADEWAPFRADALRVLVACGQLDAPLPDHCTASTISRPANDR
ncbi:MAG: hypothetical protein JF628_12000 [Sphingomonas sp.]|nr:hypothetical protein [Sphingomonas sp.]